MLSPRESCIGYKYSTKQIISKLISNQVYTFTIYVATITPLWYETSIQEYLFNPKSIVGKSIAVSFMKSDSQMYGWHLSDRVI